MRLKLKKICCVFMLTVVLFTSVSGSYMQTLKVQATFLPAIGAWEIFQWILMSVGVTVLGAELVNDLLEIPEKKIIADSLNDYLDGLGDTISNAADSASLTGARSVTLPRETWHHLSGWAKSTFYDSDTVSLDGEGISVEITSVQEFKDIVEQLTGMYFDSSLDDDIEKYLQDATSKSAPLTMVYYSYTYITTSTYVKNGLVLFYGNNREVIDPKITVKKSSNGYSVGIEPQTIFSMNIGYFEDTISYSGVFSSYSSYSRTALNLNFMYSVAEPFITVPLIGSNVMVRSNLRIYPDYRQKVLEDDLVIVTPGTRVEDGTLVGDVVLPIPADLEDVLSDVIEGDRSIPDVLEDAKVFPVPDTDEAIQDALSKVEAAAPAIDKYKLSLAEFFPFCLPFDFADFINVLKADPVAPEFTFSMPVGYSSTDGVLWQEYTISLSMFDQVAYWVRQFELLAFIIGLIMQTRSMFIRS